MSLLEHLDRLHNHDNAQEEVAVRQEPNRLAFKPGTPVISLDQYLIEATDDTTDNPRRACNLTTGEALSAKLYEHTTFHVKAHLLLADVQGVCNVVDVKSSSDGVLVFTQQTHGDLHGYLREKKRLSESEAAPLFRQIAVMIAHAHHQRIALRDIKLKKFVFTDDNRTSLSLAHLDDAQLMDNTGLLTDKRGCPAYICPEKLQSDSYSGKAADLWSLGVILYTLLVGNYPFFDSTPQELFSKVRTGYYQVPEHVSYLARSVISSLLTYDPTQRVPALAILEHPWFKHTASHTATTTDQTVPK